MPAVEAEDHEAHRNERREHHRADHRVVQAVLHPFHEHPPHLHRDPLQLERPRRVAELGHRVPREGEERHHDGGADDIWNVQVDLPQQSAADRAHEHARPEEHLALREHGLERPGVARRLQGIHEPGIDRPRVEREAQAEEHRDPHERPKSPASPSAGDVQERGGEQGDEAEEQRDPASQRVRHDSGRDLEDHGPERERGVGQQHLLDVEARAHLEQGVDPPDERHRQVEEPGDGEVGADDPAAHVLRSRPHGRAACSQSRASVAISRCRTSASALRRRMSASEILPASSSSAGPIAGCSRNRPARITGAAWYGGK